MHRHLTRETRLCYNRNSSTVSGPLFGIKQRCFQNLIETVHELENKMELNALLSAPACAEAVFLFSRASCT